jgi:hypothetical protein
MILDTIKNYLQNSPGRSTTILTIVLVIIIVVTSIFQEKREIVEPTEVSHLSDFIPDHHILVPVELINADAIAKMMGVSAFVDLYSVDLIKNKKQLLFKKVKLIKNPTDQTAFSILLPEEREAQLNLIESPVFAVLKSKRSKETKIKSIKKETFQLNGEDI